MDSAAQPDRTAAPDAADTWRGEIVLLDRSWYDRAGVERVMGFTTPTEYLEFMPQVPERERMRVRSGIRLVTVWFSVSAAEQRTRSAQRAEDPVHRWKLFPVDLESTDRWDDHTEAEEAVFSSTETADAPWTTIRSDDEERARTEAVRHVPTHLPHHGKDLDVVGTPDPSIVGVGPAAQVREQGQDHGHEFPTLHPDVHGHPDPAGG